MDDVVLPMTLAIASTILSYAALTILVAVARGWTLRSRQGRRQIS
jgi:hypothetical protein